MAIVRRFTFGVVFWALAALAPCARAADDQIRFSQSDSGLISAILDGAADPCTGSVIFPMGAPSIELVGNEYAISSGFAILDPPPCPSPPQPYELTAVLGNVADGHYTVAWTIGPVNVGGAFDVGSGELQVAVNAIPTLAPSALWSMIAAITVVGLVLVRRQRGTRIQGALTRR